MAGIFFTLRAIIHAMMNKHFSRRDFIVGATAFCVALKIPAFAAKSVSGLAKPVKFGLITDLHQDIMHDALDRMKVFVQHMKKFSPDAIIQIGDFAHPGEKNKEVIDLFKNAHREVLHVIGNHDTDAGFTKEQCISYWGMSARYYVKEVNGISVVVLDGNDKGSPTYTEGYPSYINEEQKLWLEERLKEIKKPIIIFSHQPLAGPASVDNAEEIQDILSKYSDKILLAINGHTHIDAILDVKNVSYVHINSASYFWMGGQYKHDSYSEEVHKTHPLIASTCPYKEALFATMTIDPKTLEIVIEGRRSEWVGATPEQLHYDNASSGYAKASVKHA